MLQYNKSKNEKIYRSHKRTLARCKLHSSQSTLVLSFKCSKFDADSESTIIFWYRLSQYGDIIDSLIRYDQILKLLLKYLFSAKHDAVSNFLVLTFVCLSLLTMSKCYGHMKRSQKCFHLKLCSMLSCISVHFCNICNNRKY